MNSLEEFASKFNIEQGSEGAMLIIHTQDNDPDCIETTINMDGKRFKVTRATLYEPIEKKE